MHRGRHIRGLDEEALTHLDRVLLPILQRLVRERLVAAVLILWQVVAQDRVLLDLEARSQYNLQVLASTNRLEGWFGRFQAPDPRMKTEPGPRRFVDLKVRGMAQTDTRYTPDRENTHDGLQPISTRLKQCPAC